jgi:hypothetical protein
MTQRFGYLDGLRGVAAMIVVRSGEWIPVDERCWIARLSSTRLGAA